MSEGSGEIIIKGGSCELHFNATAFEKDPNDPSRRVHKHDSHKIRSITISGDDRFAGEYPHGFKGEIRITYKP
jgi:hypothetical protein